MKLRSTVLAAVAAFSVLAPTCGKPPIVRPPPPNLKITVVGVNDFHGAIEERTVLLPTAGGTETKVRVGGAALLAAYIGRIRAANPRGTVVLGGGDMWQGSMESNYFEGRPVVLLDNAIGYDAAALGNHEFDYGPAGEASLANPSDPPDVRYGALIARQLEARFPILSANARPDEEGMFSFQPFVIVERKGVKIALVGLSTEDTPNTTHRRNVRGLAFDPPGPALEKAAKEARAQGADLVLVAAHIGGACEKNTPPDDPSACRPGHEVMEVLESLPKRVGKDGAARPLIDAFVAGHTHQYMSHFIAGIPVIESGAYGQAIGRIEIELDPRTRVVTRTTILPPQPVCRDVLADTRNCVPPAKGENPRPIVAPAAFLGGPIAPDPEIARLLAPFRQEVADLKGEVLAQAARPLRVARHEPSEMGVLVAGEMLAATHRLPDVPNAHFALQNSGGIRAPLMDGPITVGQVYEALPFDNFLTTMTVTGERLEALITGVMRTGRFMQSAGLRVEACGTGEDTTARLYELASGRRLDQKKEYVVVWNDFLAGGGDGTREALKGVRADIHDQHLLRDAVTEGLRLRTEPINPETNPLLDPGEPRFTRCRT